jgi:hypothetical protein
MSLEDSSLSTITQENRISGVKFTVPVLKLISISQKTIPKAIMFENARKFFRLDLTFQIFMRQGFAKAVFLFLIACI